MIPVWRGTVLVRRTRVPATSNVHLKRQVSSAVGRRFSEEWEEVFKFRARDVLFMDLEFGPMSLKARVRLRPLGTNRKSAEFDTGFCQDCFGWFSMLSGHPDNECPAGTVYAVLSS